MAMRWPQDAGTSICAYLRKSAPELLTVYDTHECDNKREKKGEARDLVIIYFVFCVWERPILESKKGVHHCF